MKAIDELRNHMKLLRDKGFMRMSMDTVDAHLAEIERELEEGYIEGPTDKNGNPITYRSKIYQWGALEYIACEMHPDGTYEWFVRGHDTSAPLEKAKHVTIVKPPTVEDVLNELCTKAFHSREIGANVSYKDVIAEYAAKLQLREGE